MDARGLLRVGAYVQLETTARRVGRGAPASGRQELVEAALGPPRGHLAQDVGEIGQGRHTILRAGAEQTVERGRAAGGRVRSSKEIVFPAEREGAELLLAEIMPRPG